MKSIARILSGLTVLICSVFALLGGEQATASTVPVFEEYKPIVFPKLLGCANRDSALELAKTIRKYPAKFQSSIVMAKFTELTECHMYYDMTIKLSDLNLMQHVPMMGGTQKLLPLDLPFSNKDNPLDYHMETIFMVLVPLDLLDTFFNKCSQPNLKIAKEGTIEVIPHYSSCWIDL